MPPIIHHSTNTRKNYNLFPIRRQGFKTVFGVEIMV